ncbi:MAG TPA: cytochrome c1 [Usitatibacteraceae bacterium]|nr:cytochrome c1 [Usitatibacteraceae bacterium]
MNSVSRPLSGVLAVLAFCAGLAGTAAASGGSVKLDTAPINLQDEASLQRGARNFVNYCLNCHNAAFMRFDALKKIGLNEQQIRDNLMFTTDKIGDAMTAHLDPNDAKEWLGSVPPDLTLVARSRGSDWLYTFLRGFYQDPGSPTGWNNTVFKNLSMPHVLHDLQGTQAFAKAGERPGHDGKPEAVMKLAVERSGTMSAAEYDRFVGDLVNFMTYMAEPTRATRTQVGILVLGFLVILFFLALLLKNEYWKDVK